MAEPELPEALEGTVPAESERTRLGAALRELLEAVVRVGDEATGLDELTGQLEAVTTRLREHSVSREPDLRLGAFRHDLSLVGGTAHPFAPQLLTHSNPDGSVSGTVRIGEVFQGGPGLVHGGILSLLFDHAMGHAAVVAGYGAMTVSLNVAFRAPTPLNTQLAVTARVDRKEGRKLFLTGEIHADGRLTAEANAVFVTLTGDNITAIFRDGPTPPGMRQA